MITPRRTRLVRVPDLHAFRHVIVELSRAGGADALASRMVLVPSRGAALQLGRTIGKESPVLATREELYDRLHARLDNPPPRLTAYARDVMLRAAAREARDTRDTASGEARPLRPGFIAEMLRFYDQLRRQSRTVARLEEQLDEALLRDAEHDRGAERMLAQTRFLAATFRGYERRVQASGACDEHTLRDWLTARASPLPIREIVVTLGDWIADPAGLFLADFDLLTRLPGLETVDVVATTGLLESGFHQRIHEWLPGIEEVEGADLHHGVDLSAARPRLTVPGADADRLVFVRRDREEELIAVARHIKAAALPPASLDRIAVVFKRPLPYLYLAREVFGGAGLAYQASDALPLAAEPFAAALDLVFEFVESGFTRESLIALLRSPHFAFRHEGQPIDREAIAALDRALSEKRYLGGLERLRDASTVEGPALQVILTAAHALAPLLTADAASSQFRCLDRFLDAYAAEIEDDHRGRAEAGLEGSRAWRGRAAVRDLLAALARAHAAHDDTPIDIAQMAANVRRWIEEHTFELDMRGAGLQLVDDQAARYGEFDEATLVGLIDGEWPDRPTRNIFYPSSLLASLGWPTEKDRRGAAEARFLELLASPNARVMVSTISLDDEALVEPSSFVDEIPRARLSTVPVAPGAEVEGHEDGLTPEAAEWAAMRAARSPRDAAAFHGQTDRLPPRVWSVSALETYLGCPFKFYAQHVVRLEEEPEDEEVMDPRRQGQFVHEVFEAFFRRWQEGGRLAITPDTIDDARSVFGDVVEACLERLPDAEAALERTRLLGSSAAAGLGEAVLRMEAERPVPVVARLLEHRLKDDFTFDTAAGKRSLPMSGKADRIDLLADGTFRLIDYKLGWPPGRGRALQLPIYGVCAEQSLDGYRGRSWILGEAAYLAFKGPKRVVGLFSSPQERAKVLADAQQRLVDTIDSIEAGRFPPTPDDVFRCETCTYAAVCRRDYVGDV